MKRLWLVRLGRHGEQEARLPEQLRAELPLRRTWMLVPEDEEASA